MLFMRALKSTGSLAAFIWQTELSDGFWRKCLCRTSGWNVLPKGHAAEAPEWLPHAVIARGHCRSWGPLAPTLTIHDLGFTCQNIC